MGAIQDRFSYYDIVAVVVPGTVTLAGLWMLLQFAEAVPAIPAMGDVLGTAVLLAVATLVGYAVQAVGARLEGFDDGRQGRPAERILRGKAPKYVSPEAAARIKRTLCTAFSTESDGDLFGRASALCNQLNLGRVAQFNAIHGYHRAMHATSLVLGVLGTGIFLAHLILHRHFHWYMLAVCIAWLMLAAIFGPRTRQRAFHTAREVLLMAELCCERGEGAPRARPTHRTDGRLLPATEVSDGA